MVPGPLPLRFLCFFSLPPTPPFPDLSLHTPFNVCRLHLCPTFAEKDSCRVLFFIVFTAFRCFLKGSRGDSDLYSHVYARSRNWYFPNYLISIATKIIVANLDKFSVSHKLTCQVNIFEVNCESSSKGSLYPLPPSLDICAEGTFIMEFTSESNGVSPV